MIAIIMESATMALVYVIRNSVENHVVILLAKMVAVEMETASKENVNAIKGSSMSIAVEDMFIEANYIPMELIYVIKAGVDSPVMTNYANMIAIREESATMEPASA